MALYPKLTMTGGPQLEAGLKGLGRAVAGRLGENAARAGARVIVARARKTSAFFDDTGATRRSFHVFKQVDRRAGSIAAFAGSRYFVARLLEFGTVNMPARPSLRPAMDAGGQDAVNAITTNLGVGIERETAKYGGK